MISLLASTALTLASSAALDPPPVAPAGLDVRQPAAPEVDPADVARSQVAKARKQVAEGRAPTGAPSRAGNGLADGMAGRPLNPIAAAEYNHPDGAVRSPVALQFRPDEPVRFHAWTVQRMTPPGGASAAKPAMSVRTDYIARLDMVGQSQGRSVVVGKFERLIWKVTGSGQDQDFDSARPATMAETSQQKSMRSMIGIPVEMQVDDKGQIYKIRSLANTADASPGNGDGKGVGSTKGADAKASKGALGLSLFGKKQGDATSAEEIAHLAELQFLHLFRLTYAWMPTQEVAQGSQWLRAEHLPIQGAVVARQAQTTVRSMAANAIALETDIAVDSTPVTAAKTPATVSFAKGSTGKASVVFDPRSGRLVQLDGALRLGVIGAMPTKSSPDKGGAATASANDPAKTPWLDAETGYRLLPGAATGQAIRAN